MEAQGASVVTFPQSMRFQPVAAHAGVGDQPDLELRGVPEVWGSVYDVRDLLNATVKLRDGKKATDMDMGFMEKMAVKKALGKIEGTDIEKLLKEYGVI